MNTITITSAACKVSLVAAEKETVKGFKKLSHQELFVLASIGSIQNTTPLDGYGAKQYTFDFAQRQHGLYMEPSTIQDALDELLKAGLIDKTSDIDFKLSLKAQKLMLAAAKKLNAT